MFNKVFVEKSIEGKAQTQKVLSKIKYKKLVQIDDYEEVFSRVKKPYLHKRDNLNLFLASKKGELVKEAPEAYGLGSEKHFYFVHAYNCIYECEYCYLQGYFNSPDIVWFLNHEEVIGEIDTIAKSYPGSWFHAGEYSDSLSQSHITGEIQLYYDYFKNNPDSYWELRTKSANIKEIKKLKPIDNLFVTFSLSPREVAKKIDRKAAPINARLKAISELSSLGFSIGIHLDPVIIQGDWKTEYNQLVESLALSIDMQKIAFISIGVVRFTKDVYRSFQSNYPNSSIKTSSFISSFDDKVRYPRSIRLNAMRYIKNLCVEFGAKEGSIYLCME